MSNKDPYTLLREKQTQGTNYDLTTEDIIARLEQWSEICSFTITDADADSVSLHFTKLPEDLDEFAEDIYDLCPDVVDQGFGVFDEFAEEEEAENGEISADLLELMEGLDPSDPDFGLKVMIKALERDKVLQLWWD
ncbi:MAG: DUF4253 domain-containing protein [Verrucomicrobiia bacterium]